MTKLLLGTFFTIAIHFYVFGQNPSYIAEIEKYQKHLNEEYSDKENSPLSKKQRRKFKGHHFYPINETYKVTAHFKRAESPNTFEMKTSTERLPMYDVYGIATFEIHGEQHQLTLYQSHRLRNNELYKNHLFLPFTDISNGEETYGGGRYIDLTIPDSDSIIIDFNKAYNPYCAYSYKYSCPIPPVENHLNTKIEAGIMKPQEKK